MIMRLPVLKQLQCVIRRNSPIYRCFQQQWSFSQNAPNKNRSIYLGRPENCLTVAKHVRTTKRYTIGNDDGNRQIQNWVYNTHISIGRGIRSSTLCGNGCNSLETHTQRRYFTEDRQTKTLTIWKDLSQIRFSPLPALVFGVSGLTPFICFPGYMVLAQTYMPTLAFAQVVYGAMILSFLGGIRWGITVPDESLCEPNWANLGYSVAPPLIAWAGLLLPDPLSLFTVMTGLVGTAYFDTKAWGYPSWFKGLRFVLGFVAVLSLWTTFICSFSLKSGEKDKSTSKPIESKEL